jgi:hypothetical protein
MADHFPARSGWDHERRGNLSTLPVPSNVLRAGTARGPILGGLLVVRTRCAPRLGRLLLRFDFLELGQLLLPFGGLLGATRRVVELHQVPSLVST